jgi:4-cresol dehydrogenase (hydroxylating)
MLSLPPAFLEQLAAIVGLESVSTTSQERDRLARTTLPEGTRPAGIVRPAHREQIQQILKLAGEHRISVYPISCGKNWGYGDACAPRDGMLILDLSRLNRILEVNAELDYAVIEPGVTQQALRDYFNQRNLEFLVPVHGGGPSCSIVGNILERGFGITPYADHFGAMLSLVAVLPTGDIYRSPLADLGAMPAARAFKWGVGPYVDGLFAQSSMGVVTEMTIALARRPERIEGFYFWIADDTGLEQAVTAVRRILRTLGSCIGGINLMDRRRTLSMTVPYPFDHVKPGSIMSDDLVARLGKANNLPAWMGLGTLYGDPRLIKAARSIIRRALKGVAHRILFLTPEATKRASAFLARIPYVRNLRLIGNLQRVNEAQNIVRGIPSEVALRLTAWKNRASREAHLTGNPTIDGTGLIWYTPLVPIHSDAVRTYVNDLRNVFRKHAIEPLITLTSLSERCFDSSVPLLFNKEDPAETARAEACYRKAFETGRRQGFIPYRYSSRHMDLVVSPDIPFWETVTRIKTAVDPNGILSPGRYAIPEDGTP